MIKIYKYKINKDSRREVDALFGILTSEEKKRALKFRFEKDFLLYSVGKILAKKIIAENFNILPVEVEFFIDKYQRPFVKNSQVKDFDFNISHSGEYVVLAVSDKRIGIDIERIKPIDLELSKDVFHDREIAYLQQGRQKKQERFFEIWTLKEAFVKMIGEGLSYSLKDFYFVIGEGIKINFLKSDKQEVFFESWSIDDYKIAVSSKEDLGSKNIFKIDKIDFKL